MDFRTKICTIHFVYIFFNVIFTSEGKENSRKIQHHYHHHNHHVHHHNSNNHKVTHWGSSQAGSKAAQKCKEYTSQACDKKPHGRNLFNYGSYSKAAIIGGRPAQPKEFPHMGALGSELSDPFWYCGGSLISESFVVTAAHCIDYADPEYVRFGDLDLKDKKNNGPVIQKKVTNIYVHPHFNINGYYNDIALVRIQSLSKFTDHVRPICLNALYNIPNKKISVIGWGRTTEGGPYSSKLLHVELEEQNQNLCKKLYNYNTKTMFCAGYLPGGKDACQRDSGGPLQMVTTPKGCSAAVYSLIGIVSKGKGCGRKNTPGVYTRISNFISWIESIVWK